jgi:hypothetical protein
MNRYQLTLLRVQHREMVPLKKFFRRFRKQGPSKRNRPQGESCLLPDAVFRSDRTVSDGPRVTSIVEGMDFRKPFLTDTNSSVTDSCSSREEELQPEQHKKEELQPTHGEEFQDWLIGGVQDHEPILHRLPSWSNPGISFKTWSVEEAAGPSESLTTNDSLTRILEAVTEEEPILFPQDFCENDDQGDACSPPSLLEAGADSLEKFLNECPSKETIIITSSSEHENSAAEVTATDSPPDLPQTRGAETVRLFAMELDPEPRGSTTMPHGLSHACKDRIGAILLMLEAGNEPPGYSIFAAKKLSRKSRFSSTASTQSMEEDLKSIDDLVSMCDLQSIDGHASIGDAKSPAIDTSLPPRPSPPPSPRASKVERSTPSPPSPSRPRESKIYLPSYLQMTPIDKAAQPFVVPVESENVNLTNGSESRSDAESVRGPHQLTVDPTYPRAQVPNSPPSQRPHPPQDLCDVLKLLESNSDVESIRSSQQPQVESSKLPPVSATQRSDPSKERKKALKLLETEPMLGSGKSRVVSSGQENMHPIARLRYSHDEYSPYYY